MACYELNVCNKQSRPPAVLGEEKYIQVKTNFFGVKGRGRLALLFANSGVGVDIEVRATRRQYFFVKGGLLVA